jgi:hypothetical protein
MSRGTAASADATSSQRLELPALLRAVNVEYGGRASYRDLWDLVVSGVVPAVKSGQRWTVDPADKPAVAQVLGLTRRPDAA